MHRQRELHPLGHNTMAHTPPKNGTNRRFPLSVIFLSLFVILAVVCMILFFGLRLVQSIAIPSIVGELGINIAAVPGDSSHFDPIAEYDEVHKFAGANLDLDSIVITYVR